MFRWRKWPGNQLLFAHMRHGEFTRVNRSYPDQHRLLEDIKLTLLQFVKWQHYLIMGKCPSKIWTSPLERGGIECEEWVNHLLTTTHALHAPLGISPCAFNFHENKTNKYMDGNTHNIYRTNWLLGRVKCFSQKWLSWTLLLSWPSSWLFSESANVLCKGNQHLFNIRPFLIPSWECNCTWHYTVCVLE